MPKQSSQKLCSPIAAPQSSAPAMPQNTPRVSPRCRPTRFMWSEAGMVAIALPRIQQVTGSVASALTGVSASPARPLIATSVVLLVNSIAWQAASSPTLRRVLFIYTVVD